MSKLFIFLLLITHISLGGELLRVISLEGAITDAVYRDGFLYVSTEFGKVYKIHFLSGRVDDVIELPRISDFMGNNIPPKVFSVDVSPDGRRLLIVSQSDGGYGDVYIYEEGIIKKIVDLGRGWILREGRFVSDERILLAHLGDEIAVLDTEGRIIYTRQVGRSSLSDISLNEKLNAVAIADESGAVTLVLVEDGSVLKTLSGINVDKLFSVAFRKNKVMAGGKDRRVALYDLDKGTKKMYRAEFFVFSLAMDGSASIGAYLYNERNDVKLVELDTGREIDILKGHGYPPSVIYFVEDKIIVGCDDGKLFIWRYAR